MSEFWNRVQYRPPLWAVFVNPFWLIRRRLYQAIKHHAHELGDVVLDYGCGTQPFAHLFPRCVGYDVEQRSDTTLLHIPAYPFSGALCTEVLEHVEDPAKELRRIADAIDGGGRILLTVPFVWHEHEDTDFRRYTLAGLCRLVESCGFRIVHRERLGSYLEVVAQMFVAYLFALLPGGRFRYLFVPLFGWVNLLGWIFGGGRALYFGSLVVFERTANDA